MKKKVSIFCLIIVNTITMSAQSTEFNHLNEQEKHIILNKGTEMPNTGIYLKHKEKGIYICKQCNMPLFHSSSKFDSHCGWPAFDDEINGAVKTQPDLDGLRTEILCANCDGHLGHVFMNEGFTQKNKRHCVNSISMKFIGNDDTMPELIPNVKDAQIAYFASGCFWGTQYYLQRVRGVISTTVGYMGGVTENPTYQEVCTGKTNHAETLKVIFYPDIITYEQLAKMFFETHDPTQIDRQGPDVGTQYRSAVFCTNDKQTETVTKLIKILESKGLSIATKVETARVFYPAEQYHQDYYNKTGGRPYCHSYKKLF